MGFVPIRFRISHRPRCKSLRGYFVQGRLRGNKDTSGYEDARCLLGPRSLDSRIEDPTATWHIQPPLSPFAVRCTLFSLSTFTYSPHLSSVAGLSHPQLHKYCHCHCHINTSRLVSRL